MALLGQNSTGDNSPNIDGDGNRVTYHLPPNKLGTEVQTILKVIESIHNKQAKNESQEEEHDFIRSIEIKFNRFEEHKKQLQEIYSEYTILYGYDYIQAKNSTGMDEFYFDECYVELRKMSKDALEINNFDPIKTLDFLTEKFYSEFSASDKDTAFSKPAIRYFLIKELVACNVFPNLTED